MLNVTNQIAFNQHDFHLTLEVKGMIKCRCQAMVSKLETLDTITFLQLISLLITLAFVECALLLCLWIESVFTGS